MGFDCMLLVLLFRKKSGRESKENEGEHYGTVSLNQPSSWIKPSTCLNILTSIKQQKSPSLRFLEAISNGCSILKHIILKVIFNKQLRGQISNENYLLKEKCKLNITSNPLVEK